MVLVRLLWVAWGPSYDRCCDFTDWDDLSIVVSYLFRADRKHCEEGRATGWGIVQVSEGPHIEMNRTTVKSR